MPVPFDLDALDKLQDWQSAVNPKIRSMIRLWNVPVLQQWQQALVPQAKYSGSLTGCMYLYDLWRVGVVRYNHYRVVILDESYQSRAILRKHVRLNLLAHS